jgi:hypothetical protein
MKQFVYSLLCWALAAVGSLLYLIAFLLIVPFVLIMVAFQSIAQTIREVVKRA